MKYFLPAAFAVLFGAGPAWATLQISADINGTTITCLDNQAASVTCPGGDTNPAIGTLQIPDQTIAGVEFLGSAQTQVIGGVNSLNTTSFQLLNNNAGAVPITLAVGGTDYTGPVNSFSASGSGTFQYAPGNTGSNIQMTFFGDSGNTQGATTPTTLPGTMLADSGLLTATDVTGTQAFSFGNSGAFDAASLFSMSIGTSGLLEAGATLVGRSQAIIAQEIQVSEPSSLALLGIALIVSGLWRMRARRRLSESLLHT